MPPGHSFLLSDATKALKSMRDALRREEMRAARAARGRTIAKKRREVFCIDGGGGERAAKRRRSSNLGNQRRSRRCPSLAEFAVVVVKTCLVTTCPARDQGGLRSPVLCAVAKLWTTTHLHRYSKGPQPRPLRPARPWSIRLPIDVKQVDRMVFLSFDVK